MRISSYDFDKVQKPLQAQRGGNDDSGRRRLPPGAVKCDGCGSRLVVRNDRSRRYYRCSAATKGQARYAACTTLARAPN